MAHTFIVFVCSCVFSLFATTSATLGADCSADSTVSTTGDVHSVCNSSKKCACKSGNTANGNGACAKAIVGTDCNSNAAVCADDPNSECAAGSSKKCACKDNYEAKHNAICLKVSWNSTTKTVMTASTLVMLISTIMLAKHVF